MKTSILFMLVELQGAVFVPVDKWEARRVWPSVPQRPSKLRLRNDLARHDVELHHLRVVDHVWQDDGSVTITVEAVPRPTERAAR